MTESLPATAIAPPPAPRRGALARASAVVAAGQYLARAMVLLRGWAAAAALGPQGFGAWSALNLVFDYGSYATLGALQGLDLELPGAVAEPGAARARGLMAGAWGVVLAGGAAFALLVGGFVARGARAPALADPRLVLLMLVAALLQLAVQYFTTALRAYGRFHAVSAGTATQAVAGAGLGLVLVWRYGLWGLLAGWIAGTLVALLVMRRACPEAPLVPAGARRGLSLARAGLPIFLYYVASLVLRSVDRAALVRYGTAHQLGLYGVGLMAAGLVLFVPESAAYVLFPRVAAAYHGDGDRAAARAAALRVQRALVVVMPFAVGLAALWSGPAIEALLPGYRGSIPVLRLLALGALALSTATVPSYFLLGCGRERRLLVLGAAAAAGAAGLVFGVASYQPDPVRVAVASGVGYLLFAVLILASAAGELLDPGPSRGWFVAASLAPAAWAGVVASLVLRFIPGHGATWGWVASEMFGLGYLPLLLAMGRGLGLRSLVSDLLRRPGA